MQDIYAIVKLQIPDSEHCGSCRFIQQEAEWCTAFNGYLKKDSHGTMRCMSCIDNETKSKVFDGDRKKD